MQKRLEQAIKYLAGTLKSLNYYPPGHPTIIQPVEKSLEVLEPILAKRGQLVLAVLDKTLVIEQQPFYQAHPAIEELVRRMEERVIQGFTFKHGITSQELIQLFQLLLEDPQSLEKKGGIEAELRARRILHIAVKKIALTEEEVEQKAKKVYTDARGVILDIMKQSRMGTVPRAKEAIEIVKSMSEIILTDKNALLGLTMIQDYDEYTFNHCVNVGILSLALGDTVGLKGKGLNDVGLAGFLHDVGKTYVPKDIITKPGKLNGQEWETMKKHPLYSSEIICQMEGMSEETINSVLYHHTRYDLKGYPPLTDGEKQSPGSQIVALADCYDSMTTLRPYQKRFDPKETLEIMTKRVGTHFDPTYFKAFIKTLGFYPIGTLVRLDTNEIALVVRINPGDPNRPVVKIIYDAEGRELKEPREVSLAGRDASTRSYQRSIVTTVDAVTQGLIDISPYFQ
ncbi:MAG: HD-GYP domain-containing protein [Deltaproteobacteria bacterium]|nr:MAG: HD-GYP domain-containing protein [Deltaproteobacteria bacterium]